MDQHNAPMGSFSMPPGSPQAACIQPPMVTPTVQAPPSNDGSMQFACGNSMVPSMGVWSGQQAADGSVQFACMPHPGMAMPAQGQMMTNDGSMQFACQQQMMSMPSQGIS